MKHLALLLVLIAAAPQERSHPALTREKEGAWKGAFFFLQLADPQFGFMEGAQEAKNAERAVEHINRLKPRFAIICGDLVHPFPGAAGREEKIAEFKRIFSKVRSDVPLILVPGNHDVGNKPEPKTIEEYRTTFGEDYFGFWVGGVRCLVLNSSLYHDPSGAAEAQKAQEAWFERELTSASKERPKHIVVFQHHPWFLAKPDEADSYHAIPGVRRAPALDLMKKAGVKAVFAGHYHGNAGGNDGALEMVTTGPVGKPLRKEPSGLRIVEVREDGVRHRYYPLDEVPESVTLR